MTRLLDNMKLSTFAATLTLGMASSRPMKQTALTRSQLPSQVPKTQEVLVLEVPPPEEELLPVEPAAGRQEAK